uniref:Seminal fluid protein 36F n=1 Tax=Drosophila melanogaster TaxID=7227 RepID=C4NAP2_DROME|nr:seminal fluid protein 36F, isoform A [Drosophila melanogaster]NP_001286036.1 seminal fluid protein 36F, isoform B [Drosophila melanogaster]ACQ73726.1 seminal fluid protein 36F [Drosophila melanogaster]ACZ94290.1 seminal fluid protein 36F, isoform A [Drosophila melanogaster]AHN54550.1 seminal fluid protein 36F, isoform B [Drosophila melanogaster]|eukprot:NP_001163004.1 seminal fluid protein 36F, isoform A [Drosophila melanogaster]
MSVKATLIILAIFLFVRKFPHNTEKCSPLNCINDD